MYDITWLVRGAQSALFYYASCSPYTRRRNRRRRAREVEEDRLARKDIEAQNPNIYRQPSPYRRNQFWEEDILMGPDRSNRRKGRSGKKQQPQKRQEMTIQPIEEVKEKISGEATAEEPKSPDTIAPIISPPLPTHEHQSASQRAEQAVDNMKNFVRNAAESGKQRWNSMRYQRADEELWGSAYHSANQSSVRQGPGTSSRASSLHPASTAARHSHSLLRLPQLSKAATTESSTDSFFVPKNPPVNDLHPPVVSQPVYSKAANSWMKQPPPPPSIMGGFADPSTMDTRSRSGSTGNNSVSGLSIARSPSTRERNGESDLQRKISTRLIEGRLRGYSTTEESSSSFPSSNLLTVPEPATLRTSPSDPQLPKSSSRPASRKAIDTNLDTTRRNTSESSPSSIDDEEHAPLTPEDHRIDSHDFATTAVRPKHRQNVKSRKTRRRPSDSLYRTSTAPGSPPPDLDSQQPVTPQPTKQSHKPRDLVLDRVNHQNLDLNTPMSPETHSAFLFHYPYPLAQQGELPHEENDDAEDEYESADEVENPTDGESRDRRWSVDF